MKIERSKHLVHFQRSLYCCILTFFLFSQVFSQKIAIISNASLGSSGFVEAFSDEADKKLTVLDRSLSESAFNASKHADPFNMTTEESRYAASAIGCEYLVLIKSETQRRTSIETPEYYEAHASVYVVSSRTGRLIYQSIQKAESPTVGGAESKLTGSAVSAVSEVIAKIESSRKQETARETAVNIEELPAENSAASKNFRAPIPYRRIKPEYTQTAYLYGVTATVEIVVDLDASGGITRTEISRWAGYGLDESVEKAVRAMNWRPAERNGKSLPMRVLLRYNFKKTDTKP